MKKIILEKLSNNKTKLRSRVVTGFASELPTVNNTFQMWCPSLTASSEDENLVRFVRTSIVEDVIDSLGDKILFRTMNSTYQITVIEDKGLS